MIPNFAIFPPHCVAGTPGANLVPEALTDRVVTVPNEAAASLPEDLSRYQQILLEKQTLNIFESRHADELVKRLGPEDGIRCIWSRDGILRRLRRQGSARARTHEVYVVRDAIETLNSEDGNRTIAELAGARSQVRHHRPGA